MRWTPCCVTQALQLSIGSIVHIFLIGRVYIQVAADWVTPLTHPPTRRKRTWKLLHTVVHHVKEAGHLIQKLQQNSVHRVEIEFTPGVPMEQTPSGLPGAKREHFHVRRQIGWLD